MNNTQNWSEFGYREIEMAKELLSHIKEIDSYGCVKVEFNQHSGNVFLVDDDYNCWLMNGDEIEKWIYCPECGHEAFVTEFLDDIDNKCCKEYYKELEE
jgi:wobble nucleotide-excising tRNase|tara:strand:+ start:900 stop:1196 length:297 start_codon:yes stop_codon:yes gene_type:complete